MQVIVKDGKKYILRRKGVPALTAPEGVDLATRKEFVDKLKEEFKEFLEAPTGFVLPFGWEFKIYYTEGLVEVDDVLEI